MKAFFDYLSEIQKTNKPLFLMVCAFLALVLYPVVAFFAAMFGPRVFAWVALAGVSITLFMVTFGKSNNMSQNLTNTNAIERVALIVIFLGIVIFAVG